MRKIDMARVVVQALYALNEQPLSTDFRVKRIMRQDARTVADRFKTATTVLQRIAAADERIAVQARDQGRLAVKADRTEARPIVQGAIQTASDAELLDIYQRAKAACQARGLV